MTKTTKRNKNMDIAGIYTQLGVMSNDIKYIKKALDGNGEPGLLKDTRENTNFRIASETKNKMVKFMIGSGWVLVVVIIFLQVGGVI